MKEINEKDLEKASGGWQHSIITQACDRFEEKVPGFTLGSTCAYCKYFVGTRSGGGVCSLEQNQGE